MNHATGRSIRHRPQLLGFAALAVALAGLALLATYSMGPARKAPGQLPRLGFLTVSSPGSSPYLDAFRQGLREQGYLEGENLLIEYRYAEGQDERFRALAAELVALPVDVILVVGGTPNVQAVKNLTTTIPIVFLAAGDPVQSGLVASLARPGGNTTGLSTVATDLGGKRAELLKEAVPGITRVAALWNAANAAKLLEFEDTEAAGRVLGLQVQSLEVRGPDDFDDAFRAATAGGAEALIVLNDPLVFINRVRIAERAAQSRLPAIYENREFVRAGGLMAYGPSFTAAFQRAAYYVARILRGTSPADLPVERPTTFEFVVNSKAAQALGLTLSHEVLMLATEVIQ